MWGGCVAFDDIDFLERDYVPDSKWPITHDDIKSWYVKVQPAEYLLSVTLRFLRPLPMNWALM